MTADEPMSTPDSGGLREAVEALVPAECWVTRSTAGLDCTAMIGGGLPNGTKWSEDLCCLPCRLRAALAAHPEPVPTPDSADDATVGEREVCPDCGHQYEHGGCVGPQTPSDRWAGAYPDKCDCDGICAISPADGGSGA